MAPQRDKYLGESVGKKRMANRKLIGHSLYHYDWSGECEQILVVTQLNDVIVWVVNVERDPISMGAPAFSRSGLDIYSHSYEFVLEFFHICRLDYHTEMVLVLDIVPACGYFV